MKKTLIALAVAGISFNAAAVNLDGTTPATVASAQYASEIVLPTLLQTGAADELEVQAQLGRAYPKSASAQTFFVRYDLTNGQFGAQVVAGDLLKAGAGTPAYVSGGQVAASFVIFSVTLAGESVPAADDGEAAAATDLLTFDLPSVYATGGDVGVQYRLYTSQAEAENAVATAVSKSGNLVEFAPALFARAANLQDDGVNGVGAFDEIDVEQFSTYFADGTEDATVDLSRLAIGVDTNVILKNGANVAAISDVTSAAKLEVSGDFSAGAKNADGALDFTSVLNLTGAAVDAANSDASVITFDVAGVAPANAMSFEVDGETELNEQAFSAVFNPTAINAEYVVSSIDLGTIANLERNGQPGSVNLGLSPNSTFNQFVRIVNDSNVGGLITITVRDDAGESAAFNLGAIEGHEDVLAAGVAAKPINVKDLFAAALAENAELDDKGMLRIDVYGEVGQTMRVQSFVVGADGSAFGTTN